jgi:glycosyltransferase involved in cell wall biosynthesis
MTGAALVDVGIPTHGRPAYVGLTIESVLAQTLSDLTITVSEDGEGGGEVLSAVDPYLSQSRVRYTASGAHVGAAANMSRLIQQGSAPYVAILHDDDRWRPRLLERTVDLLEEHPECAFAWSEAIVIDSHGTEIGRSPSVIRAGILSSGELVPRLYRKNWVRVPTVVVRRAAYEEVGAAFDERFPRIYDYEMWFRLAARFPALHLDMWEAEWRHHGAQSSFEGRLRGDERLALLAHQDSIVRRDLPDLTLPRRLRRRARARALLTRAVDSLELHQPRTAARYLGRALVTSPSSALDPQAGAALLGLVSGRRGRDAVGELRLRVRRQRLRYTT